MQQFKLAELIHRTETSKGPQTPLPLPHEVTGCAVQLLDVCKRLTFDKHSRVSLLFNFEVQRCVKVCLLTVAASIMTMKLS